MSAQPPERRPREVLLLQLPAAIAAAQLGLLWRNSGGGNFLVINVLVWFCACLVWLDCLDAPGQSLRWSRHAPLGLIPLVWSLLVLSRPHTLYDPLLNAIPLAALLGLGLLLQGSPWRSFLALGLLPPLHYGLIQFIPTEFLGRLTAQLTATLLWLGGVPVLAQGSRLQFASHSLFVGPGCTGINALSLCIASVVALLVLNGPLSPRRFVLLLLAAPLISITVNGLRVTVLALLPITSVEGRWVESPAFAFWHQGAGSTLFAFVAVAALMVFEHGLRRWRPTVLP